MRPVYKVGLDGQNGGARMAMKEGWTRDSAGFRSPTGKSQIKRSGMVAYGKSVGGKRRQHESISE